jgi:hypothetical protein
MQARIDKLKRKHGTGESDSGMGNEIERIIDPKKRATQTR